MQPLSASHVSEVQEKASAHGSWLPGVQLPLPLHKSVTVHTLLSLHAPPLATFVWLQPEPAGVPLVPDVQKSLVHAFASSQLLSTAVKRQPVTAAPVPVLHVSVVQEVLSLHWVLSGVCVQAPVAWVQLSVVHEKASAQFLSASAGQVTVPPAHTSATSQAFTAARHGVPATA